MASIQPFRALRPTPANAAAVSSVPYDVVSTDEARELAARNPLSFLHVTRAEIDFPPDTDPYSAAVYERARQNLATLRHDAPLIVDAAPALYFYRLRSGAHVQTGVAGCFSVDEYEQDVIKKHERTRRDKEDDRTHHMLDVRAQTGIVFLTYKASAAVDDIATRVTRGAPLFHFRAVDEVHHTVWAAGADETRELVSAFGKIPALYIADGHHRAASAARARAELRKTAPGPIEADTFIAVAFPDSQVRILSYNRTVRDLAGKAPHDFLSELRRRFHVSEGPALPRHKGHVSMYVNGQWYTIDLAGATPEDDSHASGLDVALLQRNILEQMLKIGDIRSDKRIDFVGGARGTAALEQAVKSGKAAVAFSMFPVAVDDLIAISDAGGIMPPKSTWFEPKLRDGLLVHEI